MSPENETLTPEEEAAREQIAGLPDVEADARFRDELREAFVSGAILREHRPHRLRLLAWAAALILATGIGLERANRGEAWVVREGSASGWVHVDGRALRAADTEALSRMQLGGASVTTDSEAEIRLESGEALVLVITPGSSVQLPEPPRRYWSRTARARLERGELRGTTGSAFRGARLAVELPEASAEIRGTTFALIADGEGSCACAFEGDVRLRDSAGWRRLEPGRRRLVPPRGGPTLEEPLRPMERMKLEMLRDGVWPGARHAPQAER